MKRKLFVLLLVMVFLVLSVVVAQDPTATPSDLPADAPAAEETPSPQDSLAANLAARDAAAESRTQAHARVAAAEQELVDARTERERADRVHDEAHDAVVASAVDHLEDLGITREEINAEYDKREASQEDQPVEPGA